MSNAEPPPNTVHRVTVRGRFADLTEQARRYLAGAREEHDVFRSAYTAEGTFTYDQAIRFFNLRYEIRGAGGDDEAGVLGLEEAEQFLRTMGFGHTGLTVNVVDTGAIWDNAAARAARRG
ncbi:MAG: DUF6204 family protein [Ilumatobacteraceae bacterium]|nr:hypothetical protein [Ilumatobacter sp.]MCB0983731.1 hypothetical protein [Ilumatobacter sp.]